jgi:dephospho-CoA kinase
VSALRVGLTGGLASGKSTVGRRLAAAGFVVVDADRVVTDLYRPGAPGAAAVAAALGSEFLTPEGGVDKARVAARVFADPTALATLERAVHPLVAARFAAAAASAGDAVTVLEATKLVESGLDAGLDIVVTVEAPVEARVRRAVGRGLPEAEARARLAAQDDGALRRARADIVIENAGELGDLLRRTDELVERLRERAG